MSYIPTCNEIDVFQAVRFGNWDELAKNMIEHAEHALDQYRHTSLGGRSTYRQREIKAESISLPFYPMVGVFHMRHKEGNDKLLATLAKDKYVKRMDCSKLVMHLVQTNPSGLVWALNEGWGSHFGLLQSRQSQMDWYKLRNILDEPEQRQAVDTWIRLWAQRNPLILKELNAPTHAECQTLLVEQLHVSPKELGVFMQDDPFRGFFHAMESLGQWDSTATMKQKALSLLPYFSDEPAVQMALPNNFEIEV